MAGGLHHAAQQGAAVYDAQSSPRSSPAKAFYPAEAYHQDYLVRHPNQPYIVYNDLPKIEDLKEHVSGSCTGTEPVLVGSAP